uniref:Arrestin C-terminal-like domain-containing protein n=1 Tax=Panagrolaimus sp. ES5 TaxID=591445 RepID=A0AC34FYM0_9BILA
MARLQILLDNPTNIYFPSSLITGKVDVQISKPIKATKINVKLIGKAAVKFHFGSEADVYNDKQYIVNRELLLWSSSNGKVEQLSNNQSFQFSFVLPENSPSTFKSKKGEISYKIVAEISIPWSLGSNCSTVHFIVQPSPVNSAELNYPKNIKKENENVKATLSLSKTVFSIGESIPFSLEIFNYSGKNSATVESGIECITSYSGKRSKTSDTRITKTKTVPYDFKSKTVNLHKKRSTTYSRSLEISKDLVATFDGHLLIKVQYSVFAIIRFKNSTKEDTKLSIPIILTSNSPNILPPESTPKIPINSSTNRIQPTAPSLTNSFSAPPRPLSVFAPENQLSSFEPPPPYDSVMMKA